MAPTQEQIKSFQKIVLDYHKEHGRHHLPWRTSHTTPYHIMVSEIMLQQTQVDRVVPKFLAFMEKFPTIETLANSPQSEVIKMWVGLGYNRRARFLHLASQEIVSKYQGIIPSTLKELVSLPGLGPYTSSAILAFAYNKPVAVIETNIRTVYIHHFCADKESVSDTELLPYVQATIDNENPRQWYAALMDYGTHLKTKVGNLTQKSKTYTKQSKFAGSNRQIRGVILRELTKKSSISIVVLTKSLTEKYQVNSESISFILSQLETEKLVTRNKDKLFLV